jgi:hypothetical protein
MTYLRFREKTVDLILVYYGPPGAGKRTTLERLHRQAAGERKTPFLVMPQSSHDRIEFGLLGNVFRGFQLRYLLKTASGDLRPPEDEAHRSLFRWVDGVVFVGDARRKRQRENELYWMHLGRFLAENHLFRRASRKNDPGFPVAVQWNRVDGPAPMLPPCMFRMGRPEIGIAPATPVPTVASRGKKVSAPFRDCARRILQNFNRNMRRK